MANRGDVISVDKLWDIFDRECEKAWEGVDAPVGSSEWNIAAGKIDTINNICEAVHGMNTCSRSDWEKYEYTCRDVVPARHGPCMGSDRKMTNADMIRSMSDEELAANLTCPNEMGIADIPCDKSDQCNCYKCLLDWLRQ